MLANTIGYLCQHPLTSGNKLATLRRFFGWQLASRVLDATCVIDFVDDSRLMVRRGEHASTGNLYTGLHEFAEMAFALHALRSSDLFVDVGANIGAYSVLAARCVGARTIAFEPVEATFERLLDNVRLNVIEQRVQCLQVGLAAAPGHLEFTQGDGSRNRVLRRTEAHTAQTATTVVRTLDAVLAEESGPPAVIKLDVEGFEGEVLAGSKALLAQTHPCALIIEMGQGMAYGHTDAGIDALLRASGFVTARYSPFARELEACAHNARPAGDNAIYIRNLEYFRARVLGAPRFRVLNTML